MMANVPRIKVWSQESCTTHSDVSRHDHRERDHEQCESTESKQHSGSDNGLTKSGEIRAQ
jgi:hypothetical protein